MPITQSDIERSEFRINFLEPGEVTVLVGPCSAHLWKPKKIAMDGRHYRCAGKLILKNGLELRANLQLRTHTFDFLERDAVYCQVEDTWYRPDEPELLLKLGISAGEAFPYTWLPDRPLDFRDPGPYPMDWYAANSQTQ